MRIHLSLVLWGCLIAGCASMDEGSGTEDRDRYIDFCRTTAMELMPDKEDPDDFMSKPDWMVHPCSATDREFKRDYKVVYADRRFLSFYCSDYSYTGGAHGSTQITVGTIDRKSGRILKLDDVSAFSDRVALQKKLHAAVLAKIGKNDLQDEVKPHDNFYLSKDGWHFVFNEYEVACYAEGAVEVVVDPRRL